MLPRIECYKEVEADKDCLQVVLIYQNHDQRGINSKVLLIGLISWEKEVKIKKRES